MFRNATDTTKAILFAVTAILLACGCVTLGKVGVIAYMFTPLLAVLLMTTIIAPEKGFQSTLRSLGLAKLGISQWSLAILLPLIVLITSYLVVGKLYPQIWHIPSEGLHWGNIIKIYFMYLIQQTFVNSLGEEIGWRGYLTPKLTQHGAIKGSIGVGLVWAFWHYPLILSGNYVLGNNLAVSLLLFTLTLIMMSVFLTYMRLRSGSVWPASLFHSSHNTIWGLLGQFTSLSGASFYLAGETGIFPLLLYGIAALILGVRLHKSNTHI